MAGSIPQSFIDDVLNRIDIVELIDRRVILKKAGKEHTACCPFHGEKTPSFTVSSQKQFYHCFGCGAHGNAISFLMEFDHLSFVESIEELAHLLGLEVPRETNVGSNPYKEENQALYSMLEKVAAYFQDQLRLHSTATNYLKNRGLTGDIAKRVRIGFAPPGWNNLTDHFSSAEDQKTLEKAGLIVEKQSQQYYDRFRNRIIFPILDRRGRVIAFGGRVIDPEDTPKYYNSPETPVFQKGRELYGLYEARQNQRKLDRLLVVEGYMDVAALAQFEINYAVATLGTSTSIEHVEAMYRAVTEIVYCFDGDAAGRKAAWRAMENSLGSIKQGRQLSFLFLPDGEDPDTMVRKEGKESFEQRIINAMAVDDFIINTLAETIDTNRSDGKSRFIEQFKLLAIKINDEIFRELITQKAAEFINTDKSIINKAILGSQQQANLQAKQKATNQSYVRQTVNRTPIRTAITLLLQNPEFANSVENPESLTPIKLAGIEILTKIIEILKIAPNLKPLALLERFRGTDHYRHLAKIANIDLKGDVDNLRNEFVDILSFLIQQTNEDRWSFLQQKLQTDGLSNEEINEYKQLLIRQNETSV